MFISVKVLDDGCIMFDKSMYVSHNPVYPAKPRYVWAIFCYLWHAAGAKSHLRYFEDPPRASMCQELIRNHFVVANYVNKYYVIAFAINYTCFPVWSKDYGPELLTWNKPGRFVTLDKFAPNITEYAITQCIQLTCQKKYGKTPKPNLNFVICPSDCTPLSSNVINMVGQYHDAIHQSQDLKRCIEYQEKEQALDEPYDSLRHHLKLNSIHMDMEEFLKMNDENNKIPVDAPLENVYIKHKCESCNAPMISWRKSSTRSFDKLEKILLRMGKTLTLHGKWYKCLQNYSTLKHVCGTPISCSFKKIFSSRMGESQVHHLRLAINNAQPATIQKKQQILEEYKMKYAKANQIINQNKDKIHELFYS